MHGLEAKVDLGGRGRGRGAGRGGLSDSVGATPAPFLGENNVLGTPWELNCTDIQRDPPEKGGGNEHWSVLENHCCLGSEEVVAS